MSITLYTVANELKGAPWKLVAEKHVTFVVLKQILIPYLHEISSSWMNAKCFILLV